MQLPTLDAQIIAFFRRISIPTARLAIFIIFFWFGALKVLGLSPAGELVQALYEQTVSFVPFQTFYVAFGLFECLIGILFLIRGAERIVIPLLFIHMFTTFMPLFLLPAATWSGPLIPTLEGQYIIKNLVVIAAAIGIAAHLHPLRLTQK
jgi:uncharacterized membrane protein YkgB